MLFFFLCGQHQKFCWVFLLWWWLLLFSLMFRQDCVKVVVWKGGTQSWSTFHHSLGVEVFIRAGVPPLWSWTWTSGQWGGTDPVTGETKAVSQCHLCRPWSVDRNSEILSRIQIASFGPHSSTHGMEMNSKHTERAQSLVLLLAPPHKTCPVCPFL